MEDLSVTDYIKKAFQCKELGSYKQAIEFFYKALTIDSESSEIMAEIAGLYFKMNNTDRAIEYYEQALSITPFNLDVKFNLALVYKHIGNMQKAINLFDDIYKKEPKLEYFVELIHSSYLENRFEEVVDMFLKSPYKDAISDLLHYYVGLSYSALSKKTEAEKEFRRSIECNSKNLDAKYSLAELLFDKKMYNDAEFLLLEILDAKICAKSYFLVGEINFAQNRLEKAINYISIACNIELYNPVYFYELATIYSLKGFMQEAEDNFLKAIKLSPNNLSYNYALAYLYYQTGEISKADQRISYILSINAHHVDSLVLKALILSENDEVVEANKLIDDVLERTSTNDFAFYVKAILYKKLNWWEKAIEMINKALAIKPDSLEYMSELALYNYEAKVYGDTKAICKKIVELDEKYLFAYIMLGKVFIKNQDYRTALKYLDTALTYDRNSCEAYYLKAQVLKATELKNMAIENAKYAVSLEPSNVLYYDFIAQCYFEQEKYKDACYYYKEASALDMLNVKYKYYIAKCSQNLNEVNNAISNYSVARRLEPANVEIATEYANFLRSVNKFKQALDVLKSTLEYNPTPEEKIELITQIKDVEFEIAKNAGGLKKFFAKLGRKK